ncbi:MAG: RNA methyltransferase [Chitinophagaceae bacterium]|nr:MAG: RNA methyltransferase [Chitinophagaceae bacterium]
MLSKSEVKYIQSLQQKKFRDVHKAFVAEGPKVVGELIQQKTFAVKKIFALEEWFLSNGDSLLWRNEEVVIVKEFELEKISFLSTANQVLAVFSYREDDDFKPLAGKITLMLEDIRDPGNFGTIIRIADWFGVSDVVCSKNCVDMYNPKVVQSTMASLGRVNIHYSPLEDVCRKFPEANVYAAVLGGIPLPEVKVEFPAFLLIGNEGAGLSETMISMASEKISIPGAGGAESLNAAVATGILLYSFTR